MDNSLDDAGVRLLFARNLRRLRETRRISQLNLSSITGLANNFINEIENCNKWVSADTIAKFSRALDVEPYRFFLPESRWNEPEIKTYLDDVADSLQRTVGDVVSRYSPEKKEGEN
ncbi:MAG: helix-turn-helix domain-containing protein [Treponema sp.]|jgi:transcriptional regulator with XRE-family HTH domain|nr:helix-turn-helix domain-containing protein [Treponema sp.]